MHRLHSRSALRAFRIGTLLLALLSASLLAAVVLAVLCLTGFAPRLLPWFLLAVAATPVIGALYLGIGFRARCPLCMNPPLVPRRCQKHRNARRLLGSHRLRVAASIVLSGTFTCPYCGERTRLALRDRRRPR
jgi:hypothetical protein